MVMEKIEGGLFPGPTAEMPNGKLILLDAPLDDPTNLGSPEVKLVDGNDVIITLGANSFPVNLNGSATVGEAFDKMNAATGNRLTFVVEVVTQPDGSGPVRLEIADKTRRHWESLNKNLAVTEVLSVAHDPLADVFFAGTQDNGTILQQSADGLAWKEVLGGDGNTQDVVDLRGIPDADRPDPLKGKETVRLSLSNNFSSFSWFGCDKLGMCTKNEVPLRSTGRSAENKSGLTEKDRNFDRFTLIPFDVNSVERNRLLIGLYGLYESTDFGQTITEVKEKSPPANTVSALAYGGNDPGNAAAGNVIYVARGNHIGVRKVIKIPILSLNPTAFATRESPTLARFVTLS